MAVSVFHCADLHLDSPFSLFSPGEAERRRTELRGAFTSAVLFAKSRHADIFIISGDLFDGDLVTRDTCELLRSQFESFPECRFFISPGNHDPYNDASVYRHMDFPSNVHVFGPEKERVRLDGLGVDVYGFGFTQKTCISSPVAGYPALDGERINILVCHGDTSSPLSPNGPVTKAEIAASGFDYIALGHIHAPSGVLKEGGTYYAYPGCLEGRSFDEPGYHGALFGQIDKGANRLEFVKFSKRRYETAEIDITGCEDKPAALERIRAGIRTFTDDTALRVVLTGESSEGFIISPEDIGSGPHLPFRTEIIDRTVPRADLSAPELENTLRGIFYSKMLERLEGAAADSDEYRTALDALKYGLGALDGRSIGTAGGER